MVAVKFGHFVITQILLENGSHINAYNNQNMESALTYACSKGYVNIVRLLLEFGADTVKLYFYNLFKGLYMPMKIVYNILNYI